MYGLDGLCGRGGTGGAFDEGPSSLPCCRCGCGDGAETVPGCDPADDNVDTDAPPAVVVPVCGCRLGFSAGRGGGVLERIRQGVLLASASLRKSHALTFRQEQLMETESEAQ